MEKNNTVRTHRVGAFTSGFCMIGFGILLLLHNILDIMTYEQVLGLWPIILIGMGVELLLSNLLLMILMLFFRHLDHKPIPEL